MEPQLRASGPHSMPMPSWHCFLTVQMIRKQWLQ